MLSLAWRRGAPSGWKTHRVQNAPGSVGEAGRRGCFWSVLKAETCDQRGAVGSEADVQLAAQTCRRSKEETSQLNFVFKHRLSFNESQKHSKN